MFVCCVITLVFSSSLRCSATNNFVVIKYMSLYVLEKEIDLYCLYNENYVETWKKILELLKVYSIVIFVQLCQM